MSRYRFTSESVTEGHPDKLCDQVSDAILDAHPRRRTRARASRARRSPRPAWSSSPARSRRPRGSTSRPGRPRDGQGDRLHRLRRWASTATTCAVLTAIEQQSPDISQGVTEGDGLHKEQGAGDQGLMFGYATDETPELMPAPISYAHQLARQLAAVRKTRRSDFLRPDGKTQVTLEYENDVPVRIDAIVVSTQHDDEREVQDAPRGRSSSSSSRRSCRRSSSTRTTKIHVNPTGRFVVGGPQGDCGLTGPQDHRRHVRRHGPSRRRRLQRQGPEQGRSQRLLLRALHREERGRVAASRSAARCRSRTPSASRSPSACT